MGKMVRSLITFMTGKRQRTVIASCLLYVCAVAAAVPGHAGAVETVRLIRDIAAGTTSSDPNYLAALDGTLFFAVSGGTSANGLWKSDGTEAGTVLVKSQISPAYLTTVNGTLFFRAYLAGYGVELWKSDGTETGTVMVTDLYPGTTGSIPESFSSVNGTLFFTADGGSNGKGLWKTDGTAAGTVLLKANSTATGTAPKYLTNVNGTLYFVYEGCGTGSGLWKSDGTADGTVLIKGFSCAYPSELTDVNGTLFFAVNDGTRGTELWKSDGTESGTVLVKDINPGAGYSSPQYLKNCNGTLFFKANDAVHGQELWKSDGTEAGTVQVKDINPGVADSYPNGFAVVNGTLYLRANDGINGMELWKSDGSEAGTVLVKDLTPGSNGGFLKNLTDVNGTLYLSSSDQIVGQELWKSDGTGAGTVLVKDIYPGSLHSYPEKLTNVNGILFFTANDGTNGIELWAVNPNAAPLASIIMSPTDGSHLNGAVITISGKGINETGTGVEMVEVSTNNGTTWQIASGTASWSYLWYPAEGSYTIRSRAMDAMGAVEIPGPGVSVVIDRTAPVGSVDVNGGAATTDRTAVTLTLNAIEPGANCPAVIPVMCGASSMQFSSDLLTWSPWEPAKTTKSWQLSTGDGEKVVYARFRDLAGNMTPVYQDRIVLDTSLMPKSVILAPAANTFTNSSVVVISGTASPGTGRTVQTVEISLNGGTSWTLASGTTAWSYAFPLVEGRYTVISRATDNTGYQEVPGPGITLTVDRTPPEGNLELRTGQLIINASATQPYTGCLTVYPFICGDLEMQLSSDGVSWSAWQPAVTSVTWPFDRAYVRLRDRAGNLAMISTTGTPPPPPPPPASTIVSPAHGTYTNATSVTISGIATENSGTGLQEVEVSTDGGTTWHLASGTTAWSYGWTPASGRFTILSRATDNTGTRETPGPGITVTVDRILPTGTLGINNGQLTINASATIPGMSCILVYPFICGNVEMQLSPDGIVWGAWQAAVTTVPWSYYSAYARLRDGAGNLTVISKSVTPPPIRFGDTLTAYDSLQSACDDAQAETTIQLKAGSFSGNIVLGRNVPIVMRGGYREDFSARIGYSIITGLIAVNAGEAMLEGLEIHGSLDIGNGKVVANDVLIL